MVSLYLSGIKLNQMKKLIYSLAILLLFASCDQVIFPEPQPRKVKQLKAIPEVLHGIFLDHNGDSLFVYEHSFSYSSDEYTPFKNVYLSDSAVLKTYQDKYFFNMRILIEENFYWLTYMIYPVKEGGGLDIYAMDPGDVVKLAKLQEITSKIKDIDNGESDYYLFNPKKRNYKKIISDTIFTKMISFRKAP